MAGALEAMCGRFQSPLGIFHMARTLCHSYTSIGEPLEVYAHIRWAVIMEEEQMALT